jgi:CRP-like cAMP-binding protein
MTEPSVRENVAGRDGETSSPETSRNEILARLSAPDLATLMEHAEEVEVHVREQIFGQGDPVDTVYFPLTAMVSLVIVLKHGPTIEALTVGKEGFTAQPLLNGVEYGRLRGVCQIEGTLLAIKADAFKNLLDTLPDLKRRLLRYSQYATDVIAQTAACNSTHTIEQRCARWLLITSDAIRNTEFSLTQEFLSQMLAVRRPGVNVAMRALARRELISHRYAKVTLLDVEGLREASCECYETIREKARELLG